MLHFGVAAIAAEQYQSHILLGRGSGFFHVKTHVEILCISLILLNRWDSLSSYEEY